MTVWIAVLLLIASVAKAFIGQFDAAIYMLMIAYIISPELRK